MNREDDYATHPASFLLGTVVGRWRVVYWAGRGVYGAVYKAERVGQEQAGPVALKMAVTPGDPRFAQEAELLRRLRHPSIPQLEDAGEWQRPTGEVFPFVVMQWLEGLPLYEWARRHNPTSAQVCLQLGQLAGALAELQAQQCVHRDVKGDNIVVRLKDGRAFLTDFGTGYYPGAAALTPPLWFPGTPAYQSPESRRFALQAARGSAARYRAGPPDDLYALGMTAWRLLTGRYPEVDGQRWDEAGSWSGEGRVPAAPHALNPRVDPRLSALCLRMLSVSPQERGTAAQMAEALEQLAHETASASSQQIFVPEPLRSEVSAPEPRLAEVKPQVLEEPPGARGSAGPVSPRALARPWLRGSATAVLVLMLAGGARWVAEGQPEETRHEAGCANPEGDEDTTGLGEAASLAAVQSFPAPSAREVLAEEPQPEPVQGQARPDAKGRCPEKWQVALNGGCWAPVKGSREACEALGGQLFKGTCYGPVTAPRRPPTSSPTRDP
jgi:hypothetical protein